MKKLLFLVTKESILKGKRILGIDNDSDALIVLKQEILKAAPNCHFEKATDYENAAQLLGSSTYDLVILDILSVRSFDLLRSAMDRFVPIPVVMLTPRSLNPEVLTRFVEMGARAFLPKEDLREIIPFLEDKFRFENIPAWKHLLAKLEGVFTEKFKNYKDYPGVAYYPALKKKMENNGLWDKERID